MAGAPSLGVAGPKAARGSGVRPSRPTRLSALACRRRDTRPAGMPEGIPRTRGQSERGEQEPDDHSWARGRALAPRRAWPNRERGCSRSLAHRGGMPACRCVAHRGLSTPPGGHYLPGRRAVCRLGRHRLVARPAAQGRSRQPFGRLWGAGSRFEPSGPSAPLTRLRPRSSRPRRDGPCPRSASRLSPAAVSPDA